MEKLYFGDREVLIKKIFEKFNVAVVIDTNNNEELFVDLNFLSNEKDNSNYIKLK